MRFRARVIILVVLVFALLMLQFVLPSFSGFMDWYVTDFFGPLQHHKINLFAQNLISVGDIIYSIVILLLLYQLIRIVILFIKNRRWSLRITGRIMWISIISVSFLMVMGLLWNINYKRDKIVHQFYQGDMKFSLEDAVTLQLLLIDSINQISSAYGEIVYDFQLLNIHAKNAYRQTLSSKIPNVHVEPSIFGHRLQNIGIQGYYNPITSEAQVNKYMPSVLMPFVIVHEMAHQLGVANEGDANLVSYIVCTQSDLPHFRLSAYLNIFLYNNRLIQNKDSVRSQFLYQQLNRKNQEAIQAIYAYRQEHKNWVSKLTLPVYELFLRLNGEDGLGAYSNVAKYAMIYERYKKKGTHLVIRPY